MATRYRVERLDHVQLAMPAGAEDRATASYEGGPGHPPGAQAARARGRGGCWFEHDGLRIHLGEEGCSPARKAHPALAVTGIGAPCDALEAAGHPVRRAEQVPGTPQWYVDDLFGNRIEPVPA